MADSLLPKPQHYYFGLKHVLLAETFGELARVLAPDVNLVVFPRLFEPDWRPAIQEILLRKDFSLSLSFHPGQSLEEIGSFFEVELYRAGISAGESRSLFAKDLAQQTHAFLQVSKAMDAKITRARANLGFVSAEDSRPWHTGYMRLRQLCSYTGSGLEWVRNDDVNREGLGSPSTTFRPRAELQHVALGAVALVKGELFQFTEGRGLIHRIPKAKEGQKTLFFSVELPEEAFQ